MGECDFSVECEEFLVDLESVDTVEEIVEPTGLAAPERQSDSAKYSDLMISSLKNNIIFINNTIFCP